MSADHEFTLSSPRHHHAPGLERSQRAGRAAGASRVSARQGELEAAMVRVALVLAVAATAMPSSTQAAVATNALFSDNM
jgi:hypothetical protein